MPTKIITKNGSGVPAGGVLDQGELAVDLTNKKLYSSTDGTDVVELGVSSGFAAGAEATPSITFAADTNTGFYSSGADEIALSCSGDAVMTVFKTTNPYLVFGNTTAVGSLPATGDYAFEMSPNGITSNRVWSGNGFFYPFTFHSSSGQAGSIECNGTTTTYNTSSDYRLKEDAQPITSPVNRVKQLNPVNFAWKHDGSRTDGFIAHELQAVVPYAVSGEKDAVGKVGRYVTPSGKVLRENVRLNSRETQPNGTGFIFEELAVEPEYQGVDHSKLVPLLVAAVQELTARVEALEAP